ncbi:MAG: D-alanyl-D-alanine carboxypeptidase family protein, partial [Eudoraea sp.]
MKRRSFIKNSGLASLAITTTPFSLSSNYPDYTMEELMGKEDIELFGKDINLREQAYEAFVEMQNAAMDSGI